MRLAAAARLAYRCFPTKENDERAKGRRHAEQSTQKGARSRAHRRRGSQNRGRFHNRLREAQEGRAEVPGVRPALRRLRQAPAQALEGPRPRRRPLLPRARPRQGPLPGARRARRARPLGEVRLEQVRLGLRGLGRVARAAHVPQRPGRARPRRLAHRRRHMRARRGVAGGGRRPRQARGPPPHRRRRDELQEGPEVHDGRGGPRPRAGRVGLQGPRQGQAQRVPRPAHRRAEGGHRGGHRRRGVLDRRRRRRAAAARRARGRPVPRGLLGDRRARRPQARDLEGGCARHRARDAGPGAPGPGRPRRPTRPRP